MAREHRFGANTTTRVKWTEYVVHQQLRRSQSVRVFQFSDKYRGDYSGSLKSAVCPFYCSYSGYQDELLWCATWLHKAPLNPPYLSYIQANCQVLGAAEFDNTFGWDNKHAGARILLSKAQSKVKAKGPGPDQDDRVSLFSFSPRTGNAVVLFHDPPWDESMFGLPLPNWAQFIIGLSFVTLLALGFSLSVSSDRPTSPVLKTLSSFSTTGIRA